MRSNVVQPTGWMKNEGGNVKGGLVGLGVVLIQNSQAAIDSTVPRAFLWIFFLRENINN